MILETIALCIVAYGFYSSGRTYGPVIQPGELGDILVRSAVDVASGAVRGLEQHMDATLNTAGGAALHCAGAALRREPDPELVIDLMTDNPSPEEESMNSQGYRDSLDFDLRQR